MPLFNDVLRDANHLSTYKAYMAQMEYQRPLTVAPGTPKDRLEILRRAFQATLTDPEFLSQAQKSKLDVTYVAAEEIEKIVNEVLSISPKSNRELAVSFAGKIAEPALSAKPKEMTWPRMDLK